MCFVNKNEFFSLVIDNQIWYSGVLMIERAEQGKQALNLYCVKKEKSIQRVRD